MDCLIGPLPYCYGFIGNEIVEKRHPEIVTTPKFVCKAYKENGYCNSFPAIVENGKEWAAPGPLVSAYAADDGSGDTKPNGILCLRTDKSITGNRHPVLYDNQP